MALNFRGKKKIKLTPDTRMNNQKRMNNHAKYLRVHKLFYDGGPYLIEISLLICSADQWTSFYIIGTSAMKELIIFFSRIINGW